MRSAKRVRHAAASGPASSRRPRRTAASNGMRRTNASLRRGNRSATAIPHREGNAAAAPSKATSTARASASTTCSARGRMTKPRSTRAEASAGSARKQKRAAKAGARRAETLLEGLMKPSARSSLRAAAASVLLLCAADALAQALPNPYRLVDGWAKLPGGRQIGAVGDVDIDVDGRHVWAVLRCDAGGDAFGYECLESNLDVVVKFAPDGTAVESFGGGLFIWPHGIRSEER